MIAVSCQWCGSVFQVKPSVLRKGQGKYCSVPCRQKGVGRSLLGHVVTPEVRGKIRVTNTGKTPTTEIIEKIKATKAANLAAGRTHGSFTGKTHSLETKQKMQEAARKRFTEGRGSGFKRGNQIWLGRQHSPEAKEKIALQKVGTKNPQYGLREEDSPSWKGDDVGYWGLHEWVARQLGTPSLCEFCGRDDATRYEWANKSGRYLRDLSDWIRLCKKCHNDYDGVNAWQNNLRSR